MGNVYAYEDHNGWNDMMFLTDHELSDYERFCAQCEEWSRLIGKVDSKDELIKILSQHAILQDDEFTKDTYLNLIKEYEKYADKNYAKPVITKENLEVGVFFFVDGNFAFVGCKLSKAENYGDFQVYSESHDDVWNNFKDLKYVKGNVEVDYDYFPRGRVTYRKSDDTFIIYYDKCVESEIHRISSYYADYRFLLEHDEHYCCHKCNPYYVM